MIEKTTLMMMRKVYQVKHSILSLNDDEFRKGKRYEHKNGNSIF